MQPAWPTLSRLGAAALLAGVLAACSSSLPTTPTMPQSGTPATTVATPAPTPAPSGSGPANGTWAGTGADSFSPELVRLVLSQSGSDLTGTAELNAVNPSDGTCGSCHKVKKGTLTGTVSGSAITLALSFPPGGDSPTPICATALNVTGTIADRRLTGTYVGTDSCEGLYSNGTLELAQQ